MRERPDHRPRAGRPPVARRRATPVEEPASPASRLGNNQIQRYIKMAKSPEWTKDEPATHRLGVGPEDPGHSFPGTYFNAPNVLRGAPKADKFVLLDDFAVAQHLLLEAVEFLFGSVAPSVEAALTTTLQDWMGVLPFDAHSRGNEPGDVLVAAEFGDDAYAVREMLGTEAQFRYYHSFHELAWAIANDVASRDDEVATVLFPAQVHAGQAEHADSMVAEREVAAAVLGHAGVLRHLVSLAEKLKGKVQPPPTGAPAYAVLHGRQSWGAMFEAALDQPQGTVADLVAMLHDVKDAWVKGDPGRGREDDSNARIRDLVPGPGDPAERDYAITKYGSRYNVSTVDEADPWVLRMRSQGRQLWAGPSYTMRTMWKMATAVGASREEMTALGVAMFALWSVPYGRTATPVHHFHETMAMAQEFAVMGYLPHESVRQNWARIADLLR